MIEVEGLTVRFAGITPIDDMSVVFPEGTCGLIGPNGAGKTTFFNLLSGTMACSSGEIRFKQQDVHHLPPYRIARLGIGRTFQIVRPFGELTVMENVLAGIGSRFCTGFFRALGVYHRGSFRDEARAILRRTGLGDHGNEVARNLPLGLLRRLEIARALALQPQLILLDESFSGLSHREALSLLDLIHSLRDAGMTIILIELKHARRCRDMPRRPRHFPGSPPACLPRS